ncbi:MAG: DNA repair protein RecN [Firmicutes bacterium]|nr:DNA repair protein RecN [Bacillota bacterium]NLO65480.1 DNA repair protein RecN [Bacillota bacterium]
MLRELQIRDFALIEELDLSFHTGFSVLTGETGAGKSIIIDALSLLLGQRASVEMIRTGAESTEVIGSFSLTPPAKAILAGWGMPAEEELIIAREVNLNGRNKCWINGRLAAVGQLAELGPHLVDIVGQHDGQRLLHPKEHGKLLDGYGGPEHLALLADTDRLARQWNKVRTELERLQQDERERNRQIDLLTFQIEEIAKAELEPGEEERLAVERSRLANLDRIREAVSLLVVSLGESFSEEESILSRLSLLASQLRRAVALDSSLEPLEERYGDIYFNLNDLYGEFRDYLDKLPADPDLLQEIELRLDLIDSLRRKYGETVSEILTYQREAEQQLEQLKNAAVRIDHLEEESSALAAEWLMRAEQLSSARLKLAAELEGEIEAQLADLSMANTRFKVEFSPYQGQTPRVGGLEDVEFMMAPNVGEELKPLAKIASGGELSRVLLAVKTILAEAEQTPTIIFDEIDAGIGGRTAVSLGEKLSALSSGRQVLCVTHLPVIASYAANHYSVQKTAREDRTTVNVNLLTEQERVGELTRMLGGTLDETVTLEHARELLRRAR